VRFADLVRILVDAIVQPGGRGVSQQNDIGLLIVNDWDARLKNVR
jgi:hypothetical protein